MFLHRILGHIDNGSQLADGRKAHLQLEHKPVHLCLGQGVCTVLFNGVLRSKDEERLVQRKGVTACGNGMLLHRLQKRGLGFGSGAVDFVRQDDIAENGTLLEFQNILSLIILFNDSCTGHIRRHQVGSKLNTGERQAECLTHRTHQAGLADTGDTFQQNIAACDHRDNGLLDNLTLTNQILADFSQQLTALLREKVNIIFCNHNNRLLTLFYPSAEKYWSIISCRSSVTSPDSKASKYCA